MAILSTGAIMYGGYLFVHYGIPKIEGAWENTKDWWNNRNTPKQPPLPPAKGIVIVGLPGSGKTTLYSKLGACGLNTSEATLEQEFPPFNIENVRIKAGKDFGGGIEYVDDGQLETYVKNNDLVVFLFDVSNFLDKRHFEYREVCQGRLQVIYNACKNNTSKVLVYGTHMRLYDFDETTALSEVKKMVFLKDYSVFFDDKVFQVVELSKDNDIDVIRKMVVQKLA